VAPLYRGTLIGAAKRLGRPAPPAVLSAGGAGDRGGGPHACAAAAYRGGGRWPARA